MSRDLRGNEPTPTEIHFFVASTDRGKRQKLVDLLIQERQAKKADSSIVVEVEGTLLPIQRMQLYAPLAGQIVDIPVGLKSGSTVFKDQELLRMNDKALAKEIYQLKMEIANAEWLLSHGNRGKQKDGQDQAAAKEINEAKLTLDIKSQALKNLLERTDSLSSPGYFKVKSPINGIVLSSDFREALLNRYVKPNESLLRVGAADMKNPKVSDWEVELKIPQKHMAQVLQAFANKGPKEELDVDLLLTSYPARTFKGKLLKSKIALEANANRETPTMSPSWLAWVRISGPGIPAGNQITVELLLAGTEVRVRIRSGSGEK